MVDGPTPKDNVPKATTFTWNGTQWTRSETLALGLPATGPDHHLRLRQFGDELHPAARRVAEGTFGTNIGAGDRQGTVYILLTAVPADPGTADTVVT